MADTRLGKIGITVKEPWSENISYEALDVTLFAVEDGGDGCSYTALRDNIGVTPGTDPNTWVKSTQAGQSIYDLAVKYHHFVGTEEEFEAEYQAVLQAARDAAAGASAVEAQVEAAEALRVAAETSRADAESTRQSAEASRASAETARGTAEAARQSAESGRASAETARVTAEQGRVSAESDRVSAEAARATAETDRVSDFSALKTDMETAIGQADAATAAAVTTNNQIQTAEASRVSAEQGRVSAENARASAESARATAETGRATAETARATAEGQRATAEGQRVTAENARVSAESGRDAAESARVTAEASRVSAETARESQASSDHTTSVADHAIVQGYDTRLTNVEDEVSQLGQQVIYDVTKNNSTAGPNNDGKFESLSALLSDANLSTLIPANVRCGGMSIRFVQTSDNKYVQYFLNWKNWSTDTNLWQKINLEKEVSQLRTEIGNYDETINTLDVGTWNNNYAIVADSNNNDFGKRIGSSAFSTTGYIDVSLYKRKKLRYKNYIVRSSSSNRSKTFGLVFYTGMSEGTEVSGKTFYFDDVGYSSVEVETIIPESANYVRFTYLTEYLTNWVASIVVNIIYTNGIGKKVEELHNKVTYIDEANRREYNFTGSFTESSITIQRLSILSKGDGITGIDVNNTFNFLKNGGATQALVLTQSNEVAIRAYNYSQILGTDIVLLYWNRDTKRYFGGVLFDALFSYKDKEDDKELNYGKNVKHYLLDGNTVPNVVFDNGGGIDADTGDHSASSAGWGASDYIDIPDGASYFYYSQILKTGADSPFGMAMYDTNKDFIQDSGIHIISNPNGDYREITLQKVVIPSTAKYIRCTYYTNARRAEFNAPLFYISFIKGDVVVNTLQRRVESLENGIVNIISDDGLGLHVPVESIGQLNVVKRSRQMTDIEWTPAVDLPRLNLDTVTPPDGPAGYFENIFKAGVKYKGIPYGRCISYKPNYGYGTTFVGITINFGTFKTSVENKDSMVCKESAFNLSDHQTIPYAAVCSAYVCYCLGVGYYSTAQIPNIPGLNLLAHIIDNNVRIDLNTIKIGDVINQQNVHAVIVTDIQKNNGSVTYIEISEETSYGNGNRSVQGGQYGGICRRIAYNVEDFFVRFGSFDLYRYSNISSVPYTKSPYVNIGNEMDERPITDLSVMPYEGEGFKYKSAQTNSVKLIISDDHFSYLRVFKGDTEIASSPFVIGTDTEKTITEVSIGNYTAYLCNMSGESNTEMTGRCNWSII